MDDPDVKKHDDALDEAALLTAYMKTALVPLSECKIAGSDELFIPEYRHYTEGLHSFRYSRTDLAGRAWRPPG